MLISSNTGTTRAQRASGVRCSGGPSQVLRHLRGAMPGILFVSGCIAGTYLASAFCDWMGWAP